jgi:hypothetical protein
MTEQKGRIQMDAQKYSFAVDSFVIHNTRSRHRDTDYISASVAIAGKPTYKARQKLGDLNNGTFRTAINFKDVPVADNETAVFSYAIVNSGHTNPTAAEKTLEQAVSTLAEKGPRQRRPQPAAPSVQHLVRRSARQSFRLLAQLSARWGVG